MVMTPRAGAMYIISPAAGSTAESKTAARLASSEANAIEKPGGTSARRGKPKISASTAEFLAQIRKVGELVDSLHVHLFPVQKQAPRDEKNKTNLLYGITLLTHVSWHEIWRNTSY